VKSLFSNEERKASISPLDTLVIFPEGAQDVTTDMSTKEIIETKVTGNNRVTSFILLLFDFVFHHIGAFYFR
jgi:hypothetical protein